ncbi:phosphorylase [Methylobacterium sp. Leaf399]|uniref:phosphorylase n=1 Tax=unclassified Methylobacterium TaxID=2615210 RepID=UPI0006F43EDB|nr:MULTISPECIES: phosphorylase [unclassified Methylobacterium]KQP61145.1 phosphorylase [Methylobacterium sp. Leaf108]KQT19294.1 phosphorylase [Methylobacterium sp. Leaf399]
MSAGTERSVLAVVGLSKEARLAAGPGVVVVGAGGDPHRLRAALAHQAPGAVRAVISFGIAGGLDPALLPGDVVVATGVRSDGERWDADPGIVACLRDRLERSGLRITAADLAGVDAAVLAVADKSALRGRTGAAAVDMESHVAAGFARAHGLPFAALRVVCDPADRALPAFVASALKPNGDPDILAVLRALVRRRASPGDLMRLARDSGAAFRSLRRARACLGDGLGVPSSAGPRA